MQVALAATIPNPNLTHYPPTERRVAALTPQFKPSILSAKQGGNGDHLCSLWYDPVGDQTLNLPVSARALYH